ncbi:MAG TPA: tetratricopeptide repeat protein, partial [Chloroflexi bacterium]|nr:tetratricopeptide repeat protein [Chloroflexota bacterium]
MAEISLQEYMQEIDEAIERGHYEEALAHGRHVLQHYPKHLATYRLLGKAMLEAGQDSLAEDMFRRVLSGDPEDFVARVGMSIICDRQGDLQRAIWHIERAFELSPNNEAIQGELRRLRARRDGVEPSRAELTRGGLARLYMRGNLLPRAIEEFRAILAEEPGRVDLRVALAEALWRNEQRVQAEEVCLQVLDELPYCLKANLILGEIWARSGRDEGWTYLQRAEALDPENRGAAELLGDASPLEPREVHLPHLEYVPPTTAEERPAWMVAAGVEATPAEEERALVDIEAAMGGRIEIPAWLEEIGAGEEETPVAEEEVHTVEGEGIAVPDWLLDQAAEAQMAEGVPSQAPAPEEEIPEWLRDIGEAAPTPPAVEQPTPAEEQPPEIAGEGPVPAEIPD